MPSSTGDKFRMFLAGLFILVGMGIFSIVFAMFPVIGGLRVRTTFSLVFVLLALTVFAAWLFAAPRASLFSRYDPEQHARELAEKGLLVETTYSARRAFQVAELEDEGSHYFLELDNGSVLYLNGQYLYEYEEGEDARDALRPRRFPCTEFTMRRRRDDSMVIDLQCRGHVLLPEYVARPYTLDEISAGLVPEDGQIITGRGYAEIKLERMRA